MSYLWKSRPQEDYILQKKDAWMKVEEKDQCMHALDSISAIQLILLLQFHSLDICHLQVALSLSTQSGASFVKGTFKTFYMKQIG